MAKTTELCKVHSFSNSPNLCQRTTPDVPNCYTTLKFDEVLRKTILTFFETRCSVPMWFVLISPISGATQWQTGWRRTMLTSAH